MKHRLLFLLNIWRLARPYWFSEDRWRGRLLLAAIVSMSLGLVFITVLLNKWNNTFYNTLQERDLNGFYNQLGYFCLLALLYIVIAVYQVYLNQMLQIRWRRWLTSRFLDQWLAHRSYYALQMRYADTDNPDQRIADDIGNFVTQALALSLGFLESVVTLVSFIGILWGLSGQFDFTAWGHAVSIPGYMVWVALFYSILGTYLTKKVGGPLIALNYDQQRYEADFRFSLVRLRENAEGVALYRGEPNEAAILEERFSHVVRNWWAIMKRRKALSWLTNTYAQVAMIFPFLAAAPRYFSGAMELGGLMQTASAFGRVQGALSWFVDAYTTLASWKATVDRLTSFSQALEEAREQNTSPRALRLAPGTEDALRIEDLRLDLPGGQPLLAGLTFTVPPAGSLLVSGPSGCGKSTVLRAVAGLWSYGSGTICLPASGRLLFLPQKPYLPIGSLREVLCYPAPETAPDDEALARALVRCGLDKLPGLLDRRTYWSQELSPGEQQRLAFARLLLIRPRWVFLDEATSAVDEAGEAALYQLLREVLPEAALVSVGHRSTLERFHAQRLVIAPGHPGRASLSPAV